MCPLSVRCGVRVGVTVLSAVGDTRSAEGSLGLNRVEDSHRVVDALNLVSPCYQASGDVADKTGVVNRTAHERGGLIVGVEQRHGLPAVTGCPPAPLGVACWHCFAVVSAWGRVPSMFVSVAKAHPKAQNEQVRAVIAWPGKIKAKGSSGVLRRCLARSRNAKGVDGDKVEVLASHGVTSFVLEFWGDGLRNIALVVKVESVTYALSRG